MTVTVLLHSGDIIRVPIRFLVRISDIGAGVYKEVELDNGESGLLRVTDLIDREWRKHCDSLRGLPTSAVWRWLSLEVERP